MSISRGLQSVVLQGLAGIAALVRPDSVLRVATEPSPLLYDTFDAALDTANRWTAAGTVPPTSATGTLTVSAGTVALATSWLISQPVLPLTINSYVTPNMLLITDSTLKTGNYRFAGPGVQAASPTAAAPIINGVGFEWIDTTGVLSGVVWSNSVRTQSVSLATVQPLDSSTHRYLLYYKTSRVYFEIDGVQVGSIAYPAPQVSNLPLLLLSVNGASTVSPAAVFNATFLGAADSAHDNFFLSDAAFPWRKAQIGKNGGQSVKGSSIVGQTMAVTAATPVTGAGLDVSEAGAISFIVKNTVAATAFTGIPVIVFEQSDDNVSWAPLQVTNGMTGSVVSATPTILTGAANVSQIWDASLEGVNWVRARVTTAQATNGMTIVLQPGGGFFSPSVGVSGTVAMTTMASTTGTITSPALAVTSFTVLASNANRKAATFYNDSVNVLYLALAAAASTTSHTVRIPVGGYYELPGMTVFTGLVSGISLVATGNVRVTELT